MTQHTPGPWKPDGKHMLITQLVENRPTRKRFYGIEGKAGSFRVTIAYFANEQDRDLCLALPDLLTACKLADDYIAAEYNDGSPEDTRPEYGDYEALDAVNDALRTAIAAVTGE